MGARAEWVQTRHLEREGGDGGKDGLTVENLK